LTNLGIYFFEHNDLQAAAQIWERALTVKNSVGLRFNLGRVYRMQGRFDESREHLKQFLQLAGQEFAEQRALTQRWIDK